MSEKLQKLAIPFLFSIVLFAEVIANAFTG